jgi:hypothetical protein
MSTDNDKTGSDSPTKVTKADCYQETNKLQSVTLSAEAESSADKEAGASDDHGTE